MRLVLSFLGLVLSFSLAITGDVFAHRGVIDHSTYQGYASTATILTLGFGVLFLISFFRKD